MTQSKNNEIGLFSNFPGDLMGGLMTAVVALPVAMAFGIASGLGAAAGLYGAIACGIFAAWFGGTRGQQSGPTGPMAVVVAGVLATNPGRVDIAFAATILAGVFLIVLGKLRAGELIRYLPYPVISGFMTGVALIIILLQLHPLFGLDGPRKIADCIAGLPNIITNFKTDAILISALTLGIIYTLPLLSKKIPASLIALVVATIVSIVLKMDLPRIGEIPQGLPVLTIPNLSLDDLRTVITSGMSLALLGAIDSLLTSLIADKMLHEHHNSDKELIGQGVGNICAGFIGGLAGAGSTTRTLANINAGGRTKLSGLVYGFCILAVILGLGNLASLIPKAALAGILVALGLYIVDWRAIKRILATSKSDVAVMLIVLALTLFVDLIVAVGVGAALASILFVKKISDARLSRHGTIDTLEQIHELVQHLPQDLRRTIYVYTFHGPLFFGEVKNFNDTVSRLTEIKYLILRFHSFPVIDQSWSFAVEDAIDRFEKSGTVILFVGIDPVVVERFEQMDIIHKVSPERCFDTIEECVSYIETSAVANSPSKEE